MAKQKEGPGFQSSAGLVRNFEVDERKNIRIHPGWVIASPFILAAVVVLVILAITWATG